MLSYSLRLTLITAYKQILSARMTEYQRINPNKDLMFDIDDILFRIAATVAKSPVKWTEPMLTTGLAIVANQCASGLLTWEEKEQALDALLKEAGWTKQELQDLNRRIETENN